MLVVAIKFYFGRYHSNPWRENVNAANVEWPPSPWRLIRAFYSASRTNHHFWGEEDNVDELLGRLAVVRPSYLLPQAEIAHTRHYYPSSKYSLTKQDETDKVFDAFYVVDQDSPVYVMWDLELSEAELDLLRRVVNAVSYIGRSESVAELDVVDSDFDLLTDESEGKGYVRAIPKDAYSEDPTTSQSLLDVKELLVLDDDLNQNQAVAVITQTVAEIRKKALELPERVTKEDYVVFGDKNANLEEGAGKTKKQNFAYYKIDGVGPSIYETVGFADVFRAALQSVYHRDGDRDAVSAVFSGHLENGARREDNHQHIHIILLPDRSYRRAEYVVVWAPDGFGVNELEALRRLNYVNYSLPVRQRRHKAAEGKGSVSRRGVPRRLAVTMIMHGRVEDDISLPLLTGSNNRWCSLTPFVLTRYPKKTGKYRDNREYLESEIKSQVARELEHRGIEGEFTVKILGQGKSRFFNTQRPGASKRKMPPVPGLYPLELVFEKPLSRAEPLAIGGLSHFGMGIFIPIDLLSHFNVPFDREGDS